MWPGPDAIGIIFAVSHGSAGVVVLACGLMYLEPTKGSDPHLWFSSRFPKNSQYFTYTISLYKAVVEILCLRALLCLLTILLDIRLWRF